MTQEELVKIAPLINASIAWLALIVSSFTLYQTFLRKFDPRVFVSPNLKIKFKESEATPNKHIIDFVCCDISISNSKNAYGVIDAILLRIYSSKALSPFSITLFGSELANLDEKEYNRFVPIVLAPKSFLSKVIKFSTTSENVTNAAQLKKGSFYYFEIYYKLEKRKKLKLARRIFVYDKTFHRSESDLAEFIAFDYKSEQSNIIRFLPPFKSEPFNSVSGEELYYLLARAKCLFRFPLLLLNDLLASFKKLILSLCFGFYNYILRFPLIRKASKRGPAVVKSEMIVSDKYTIESFNVMKKELDRLIKKVNKKLPKDQRIVCKDEGRSVEISRNERTAYFQIDYVHQIHLKGESSSGYELSQIFSYQINRLRIKYWVTNGRFISKRAVAYEILDSILF
ncbi:hypothetical protein [Leptospira broomii]|nr:hypothetical protein [Leptospira broomii]